MMEARRHVAWLAGGVVVSFLVPFALADQIGLQKDVYYGIYATAAVALFPVGPGTQARTWPRSSGAVGDWLSD